MYGCILMPPVTEDGDVGVLFLHNEGYSTMCGHGIIALVSVGITTGILADAATRGDIRIDTPAGRVTAAAEPNAGTSRRVTFRNVPSFVLASGVEADVPGIGGGVVADVAFGGAFYAYVDAEQFGLDLVPSEFRALTELGRRITTAVANEVDVRHPSGDSDLDFLYGTIFVGPPHDPAHHSRNVCVFAETEVDRSPTGTGVSGRLAIHHAGEDIATGEEIEVESILGTTFTGMVVATTAVGDLPAVIPEIGGSASITGRHEFMLDPSDPLAAGFLLR
jgi:trans-L-3-hydroxyproline dehydratase